MSTETPPGSRIVSRVSNGAGYLLNDSRAAHQGIEESDIVCCPHCQATIKLQAWKKERSFGGGGWCRQCAAPVCGPCLTRMLQHGCEPFIKLVDRALELAYRKSQNRRVLSI